MIAALTMSLFYKLNEQRFASIIEELSQRKKFTQEQEKLSSKEKVSTVNI
ncbi:hypothetical protein [Mangrovibacter phragmitis]|nr:hypothetical protein [Mangrovibacter phragmitis]